MPVLVRRLSSDRAIQLATVMCMSCPAAMSPMWHCARSSLPVIEEPAYQVVVTGEVAVKIFKDTGKDEDIM